MYKPLTHDHTCKCSPTGAHHWMILPVRGTPTLPAVCRYCLADRRFAASHAYSCDLARYGDNYRIGKRKEKV